MKNKNEETMENLPYTVIGHSGCPTPKLSILLTAKGIKEIAKRIDNEDCVRITEWSDYSDECENVKHYGKITVIKGKEKETSSVQSEPTTEEDIEYEINKDYALGHVNEGDGK